MTKSTDNAVSETAIAQLYEQWLDAVRHQDLDGIMALYREDIVAFDAVLALQFKGRQAYREHWKMCLEFCPAGAKEPVFDMHDLVVQVEGELAFVHALMHCGHREGDQIDASWMRMSAGLRREGDHWKIAHEHFSAPFEMPSGKAMFHLTPDGESQSVRPIPAGMSTVSAHLVCADAPAAIEFYKQAFGAQEMSGWRLEVDGVFLHGELMIGDSVVMIGQENIGCDSVGPRALKGSPVTLHLYVPDVDASFQQAVAAGAREIMPVMDMFWGDRYGMLEDPEGHRWSLATHVRDLAPEEIARAAREFCAQMAS